MSQLISMRVWSMRNPSHLVTLHTSSILDTHSISILKSLSNDNLPPIAPNLSFKSKDLLNFNNQLYVRTRAHLFLTPTWVQSNKFCTFYQRTVLKKLSLIYSQFKQTKWSKIKYVEGVLIKNNWTNMVWISFIGQKPAVNSKTYIISLIHKAHVSNTLSLGNNKHKWPVGKNKEKNLIKESLHPN